MEEKKKRRRKIRQEWRPNLLVSILYHVWRIAFAGIKIALGAVATVLLICVVCGFVFVNVLGDYLVEDVMAKAEFDLDDYKLDRTSYIYYLDEDGDVQILQQLSTTTDRRGLDHDGKGLRQYVLWRRRCRWLYADPAADQKPEADRGYVR